MICFEFFDATSDVISLPIYFTVLAWVSINIFQLNLFGIDFKLNFEVDNEQFFNGK